jgi:hypothetical protein
MCCVELISNIFKGIDVSIEGYLKRRKFFVIAAVFDKPARAAVLNMKSSNGFHGCTKCLQPGESHKINQNCKLDMVLHKTDILKFKIYSFILSWGSTHIEICEIKSNGTSSNS